MTIGLDISSLQGPHRMRGIGYTLINFINNLSPEVKKQHAFIFYYYYGENLEDPLEILELNGTKYETRPLYAPHRINKKLPGKLNLLIRFLNQLISLSDIYRGDPRIRDVSGIDVFLQTDQSVSLPRGRCRKVSIAYDLIPYVMEWDYLWNYKTARAHGLPRQAAVRCEWRRWLYIHKLRANTKRADKVIPISDVTRDDFLKYVSGNKQKYTTVPLGVNPPKALSAHNSLAMFRYVDTSWGYMKRPFKFDSDERFLLFVGGADKRRKLDDLVVAFNHLRAQGVELKLVLAGDSMQGPRNIATEPIQKALQNSSYLDDIIFMGFVDDQQRDWLYNNALAFVFPSMYEGFGLPVMEAFSYGCPVISYQNAATKEIAYDLPLYADNPDGLFSAVLQLLNMTASERSGLEHRAIKKAAERSWSETSKEIIQAIAG
jgi:glycosyltransferase involved in cell wall biosynthesis